MMMRLGGSDVDPFENTGSGTSVLLPVKSETNTVSPPKVGPANIIHKKHTRNMHIKIMKSNTSHSLERKVIS